MSFWLVVSIPLKNIVSWDDYSQDMEKTCSKPPTSLASIVSPWIHWWYVWLLVLHSALWQQLKIQTVHKGQRHLVANLQHPGKKNHTLVWLYSKNKQNGHRFYLDLETNLTYRYGGFLKWEYPQIIHLNRIFHYKPSSYWGTPHVWNLPYRYNLSWNITRYGKNKTKQYLT